MSEPRRIDFSSLDAVSHDRDVADQETDVDGTRWALVTYAPGAGRADWCDTPHSGYVLGGTLTHDFEDEREPLRLHAGDAFALPPQPRHRGRNEGDEPTRLFIIDALA
ncbi:cupin domain-containing protein [Solirubrobacter sp. CPCC 204708]|uniref:Cupin domain-containing protein n=1 Tax=Solirubrobacter deserti TaxID=2282478 RepID=A0ABT4RQF3_9ACTN|nr:cupin domain-containing protein [Solirubrobacter deserti]MBE2320572.1 cupin domain-containing protein [Solirubrobacter deserti]MDA0140799.1 cupin domain-containing protein [Solirubrobacter deserti]